MRQANYPEKYIRAIEPYEAELIEEGKQEILKSLMARKSAKVDANRTHELETAVKKTITFVLKSMNNGVDVEVSTPPAAESERKAVEAEVEEMQKQIEQMRLEMTRITGLLPDRSKPILQLPDGRPEESTSAGKQNPSSKPAK
jgi:hypothetical protein